jgi:hypothetical protein
MAKEANISSIPYRDNFAVANNVFRPDGGMGVLIGSRALKNAFRRHGRRPIGL